MGVSYRHTQVCYLMIAAFGVLTVGLALVAFTSSVKLLLLTPIVFLLCLLLFSTLTTVVQGNRLTCFLAAV